MNKICTSIKQSQKLIELGIDIKTADMCWSIDIPDLPTLLAYPITDYDNWENKISAWSLSALLDVIPEGVIENYYVPNLQKENGKYSIAYGNEELLCTADNPIDACFEMIIKLHENNKL